MGNETNVCTVLGRIRRANPEVFEVLNPYSMMEDCFAAENPNMTTRNIKIRRMELERIQVLKELGLERHHYGILFRRYYP